MRTESANDSVDATDLRLIDELTSDARQPLGRLATTLGLAASTVHARIARLVSRGAIRRFTIDVDPAALGYRTEALVAVRIRPGARAQMARFADELRTHPDVAQYFYVAGAEDFVIHFRGRDTADLRSFVSDHLSTHSIVAATNTSLIFERTDGLRGV
ncbi:Lrp/AsnC family transcriptional regulator [Microbacterium dextranolyticum]|uniref:Transcriptional regulator, AsnC family protein n=1 Tax=Microbacterium dextranolyticum TaxID=36806 RepID=A0A9W6HL63_9MICO|nr:Lrp/AsnC family transcriptional regulator [Microbacterium dextranolyticum]MBM7464202.1 DNA-binding Lrp family transcriptional regulator [Microbacterium dextranolyticum]GLJ95196.1 putative transcriptional regulator, AsnC family protein [Microbacterium dextranolyticum]